MSNVNRIHPREHTVSQQYRTQAERPAPRGGALLPEGNLGRCRRQRWQPGRWRD